MAASPASSSHLQPLSLDAIVAHFVASKRSLAATEHVYRANAIVDAARKSLEAVVDYAAKGVFMRRAIAAQQVKVDAIRSGLANIGDTGDAEFRTTLANLDTADAAVKTILATLKATVVEPSLRPTDAEPRTLHTFVDEAGVQELSAEFRSFIDRVNDAQNQLEDSNAALDDQIAAISRCLALVAQQADLREAALLFRNLEDHAAEMAESLSNLVRHYDLCATALKHTEGGGEAAEQAQQIDLPAGIEVGALQHEPPAQPMSASERAEMLLVLDNDAAEVDDVVHEIGERAADMDAQAERLAELLGSLREQHAILAQAATLMRKLSERLPLYIDAGARFMHEWAGLRALFEEKMDELYGLRHFFAGFLRAYDGLLVEIVRRQVVRSRIQRAAHDAMRKLQELHDHDFSERQAFTEEHGEFLPADIWPGLAQPPTRFEFKSVEDAEETIPEIAKETWQKATDRLRSGSL